MAPPLPYTVFALGDAQLHQLHTRLGKVRPISTESQEELCAYEFSDSLAVHVQLFVMGEVAVELFQETPTAFLQVRVHLNSFARE
jgi:hypothetical protein